MAELTPEQLKEIYNKLPEDLKEVIFSTDSAEAIQAIAKKFKLSVHKMGELADEAGLVMLGLTHPRQFISNVASRLEVDRETAGKIAQEVNSQIFVKIRDSLKKIHGITGGEPIPATEFSAKPSQSSQPVPDKKEILEEIEREHAEVVFDARPAPIPAESPTSAPVTPPVIIEPMQSPQPDIPSSPTSSAAPALPPNPFDAKTKEEVFKMPKEEKKYSSGDPYREPVK